MKEKRSADTDRLQKISGFNSENDLLDDSNASSKNQREQQSAQLAEEAKRQERKDTAFTK